MVSKKSITSRKALEYTTILLSVVVFGLAASAFLVPQTEYGLDKPNFVFLAIITIIDVACFVALKVLDWRARKLAKSAPKQ